MIPARPVARMRDESVNSRCTARRSRTLCFCLASAALAWGCLAVPALAQLPNARLSWIYPAGAKVGTSLDVSVGGTDLDDTTGLVFSHPGITAQPKLGAPGALIKTPQPLPNQFTVAIAADVPPGLYEVRTVGRYGTSTPRAFAVGDQEEVAKVDGNSSPDKAQEVAVGSSINGRTAADTADYYKFAGKAGQRVSISVWAYRIDSRVDGAIVLYDPSGTEIASCRDVKGFNPVIDYTVPADGVYVFAVYDFTYRGGPEYSYRLTLSAKPYLEYVFPPSGLAGSTGKYMLYGYNLPGGAPAADPLAAKQGLQQLEVEIALPAVAPDQHPATFGSVAEPQESDIDGLVYRLPSPGGTSNPVFIGYATAPVIREVEPNNEREVAQAVTLPCELVGQFSPNRDRDWISFEAKKGDVYAVEVISQRLGLPVDAQVIIQQFVKNEKGEVSYKDIVDGDDYDPKLGNPGFDRASDDPVLRFAAPEDGSYRLLVRDLYGGTRATPRLVYRLSIRPESPNFRLLATFRNLTDPDKNKLLMSAPVLRKGGTARLLVQIYPQDGFNEPIALTAEGLPAGVTCTPVTASPGDKTATLVFSAAADAAVWSGPISIIGKAKVGDKEIAHKARPSYVVWDKPTQNDSTYARVAQQLFLSVTDEAQPARVDSAVAGTTIETARAGSVEIPLKVTRIEGFKGGLKLDPVGLPKEIVGASVTLNEQTAEGKMELKIDPKIKPGLYTLYLTGQTKLAYKRNEAASVAAAAAKVQADAALAEITAAMVKANEGKAAADKDAADKAAAMKVATDALAVAQKAATDAEAAAKAAAEKAVAAKDAAGKATGDQALAAASVAADKAATDAAAVQKTAADAVVVAQKTADDATAAAKTAEVAKTAATEVATKAAELLKQAQAEKPAIDKAATDLAAAAQPKDIDFFVESLPIALKIAEAPLLLKPAAAAAGPVKQGGMVELAVNIERLYGFADAVEVVLTVPQQIKGVAGKLDLPAGQAAGKLVITTAKDTPVGKHALQVTAKLKYNGQPLDVNLPLELNVEAAPAEEKK